MKNHHKWRIGLKSLKIINKVYLNANNNTGVFFTLIFNVGEYILKKLIRLFSDLITVLIKAAFLMNNFNDRLKYIIDSLLLRMSSIIRMQPVV